MYNLSFDGTSTVDNSVIRAEIRRKLDEHIKQILEKPTISAEEHHLLEWVERQYAEADKAAQESTDKGFRNSFWVPLMVYLALFGFGGDK